MSKNLSEADIDALAALARLKVALEERASLAQDIDAILGYVSELDAAEAAGEARVQEDVRTITREDRVTHESGEYSEALTKLSPRTEGGYIVVKKVL